MRMMIDLAIDRLEDLHFEQDDWECGELTEDCLLNREALRMAIDTMCKYRKIKEQVDIAIDKENFATSDARLIQIREIIDGNED